MCFGDLLVTWEQSLYVGGGAGMHKCIITCCNGLLSGGHFLHCWATGTSAGSGEYDCGRAGDQIGHHQLGKRLDLFLRGREDPGLA